MTDTNVTVAAQVEEAIRARIREVLTDDVVHRLVDAEVVRLTTTTETRDYYGRHERTSPIERVIQAEAAKIVGKRIEELARTDEFRDKLVAKTIDFFADDYRSGLVVQLLLRTLFEPVFQKLEQATRSY